MSARKTAEDEASTDAGDLPFDLREAAVAPALEHRAYAAAIARAMGISAENAVALQQANGELAVVATGKSVNQILASLRPSAITRGGRAGDIEPHPVKQKES
ncbi:MAG TPA: RebB family R body protein [Caulobacteraceae bacterium]|nr:RebB family R body protein [Caulobacteraceae bacterium]